MARKKVIAYFMHEHEKGAAENVLTAPLVTDSFVMGEVEDSEIPQLESQGLIVQEMPEAAKGPLEGLSPALATASSATFDTFARAADDAFNPAAENTYTLRLAGPLLEQWRHTLETLGIRLLESVGPQLYTVQLRLAQLGPVQALDFVLDVHLQHQGDTSPPVPQAAARSQPGQGVTPTVTYDIKLRDATEAPTILALLQQKEALVVGASGRKIRVQLKEGSPVLQELRREPSVLEIYQFVPPRLSNDRARALIGIDIANPGQPFPFDGRGQIVGIADTGIDDQHPDFNGRVHGIVALGRVNDSTDPHGHGTHVAGSVVGNGTASNGAIRGTAPEAKIFFQSIMDAGGGLGGLPLDLNDLFLEAYQQGARIHNNSWGADTRSQYTYNSIEADEFVHTHRDMAIVIAAGNEGTAQQPFNAQPGFVDWLSIDSPATSKNSITVGASRSDRNTGGFSTLTWNAQWPVDFPVNPIAAELISGNPQALAGFSSRGPCDDRRIKPDVVAPGTDIASAKSSRAPQRNFWGPVPGHGGHYAFMGGTSMATPLVSGCLALIRQYYVNVRAHDPSAALLKATLINSTRKLTAPDAVADSAELPNYHQGFGCVHMPFAVPNAGEPDLGLAFIDNWNNPNVPKFVATGERLRFVISAGTARQLRFCLAFTDLPARALQNNLNMIVESVATRQKWVGNANRPAKISAVDDDNNVEIVRIENPPAGDYMVQIFAKNLLSNSGQDFALVATGDLKSQFTRVP